LEKNGQYSAADAAYQQAFALAPDLPEAHNNYGVFLCQQQKVDLAIAHFLVAAQDPRYTMPTKAYENAGLCALMIKDPRADEYFALAHRDISYE
jgi:type IV pilus assembly protein PilF